MNYENWIEQNLIIILFTIILLWILAVLIVIYQGPYWIITRFITIKGLQKQIKDCARCRSWRKTMEGAGWKEPENYCVEHTIKIEEKCGTISNYEKKC